MIDSSNRNFKKIFLFLLRNNTVSVEPTALSLKLFLHTAFDANGKYKEGSMTLYAILSCYALEQFLPRKQPRQFFTDKRKPITSTSMPTK